MMNVLREKGVYLVAWTPTVLAGVMVATAILLWFLRRDAGARGRRAKTLAWAVLPACAIGLGVAYGPMAPLFRSAGRLDAGVGEVTPDLTFTEIGDGGVKRLSEFRGKVLLVNLWATWCPPCRTELPTLNRLQEDLAGRGLVVVTLSDEPRDALIRFVGRHAPLTVNGRVDSFDWLTIESFRPFTLVIDRTGVLRDYAFGAQDYETFARKVEKYL